MHKKKKIIIATVIIIWIVGILWFLQTKTFKGWYTEWWQSYLAEQGKNTPTHSWNDGMISPSSLFPQDNQSTALDKIITTTPPDTYNLAMEFHTQAPRGEWDAFHEEMCEEASLQLILNYFEHQEVSNSEFDEQLKMMQEKEIEIVGEWESTTVDQMQRLIEEGYPEYSVVIINDISKEQIEQYIASHIPVLLPMSGRTIGNPFYKPPGPIYHILVVKGYTQQHFITNDVGTKRGKDYFYTKDTIMNNIHDWNEANILSGAKKGFVILPR